MGRKLRRRDAPEFRFGDHRNRLDVKDWAEGEIVLRKLRKKRDVGYVVGGRPYPRFPTSSCFFFASCSRATICLRVSEGSMGAVSVDMTKPDEANPSLYSLE